MKTSSLLGVVVFTLALPALLVSQSQADCIGADRMSHSNAQCLTHSTMVASAITVTWEVDTGCADYGTVVAKLDFSDSTADQTVTLTSTNSKQRGSMNSATTVSVYCCKDLGDLCNRSDVVTAANCTTQFNNSDAASTCTLSGTPTVNNRHTKCSFSAICEAQTHSATIAYTDMDKLAYCSGSLTTESCERSRQ